MVSSAKVPIDDPEEMSPWKNSGGANESETWDMVDSDPILAFRVLTLDLGGLF